MSDSDGTVFFAIIIVAIVAFIFGAYVGADYRNDQNCIEVAKVTNAIGQHVYGSTCWLELTPGSWSKLEELKFTLTIDTVK